MENKNNMYKFELPPTQTQSNVQKLEKASEDLSGNTYGFKSYNDDDKFENYNAKESEKSEKPLTQIQEKQETYEDKVKKARQGDKVAKAKLEQLQQNEYNTKSYIDDFNTNYKKVYPNDYKTHFNSIEDIENYYNMIKSNPIYKEEAEKLGYENLADLGEDIEDLKAGTFDLVIDDNDINFLNGTSSNVSNLDKEIGEQYIQPEMEEWDF